MCNFLRRIMIVAIAFALAGCQGGGLTIGSSFLPPVTKTFEITGSNFDQSFEMAYRAMKESDFEIYKSNKENGEIDARIDKKTEITGGNTFTTTFTDLKFYLQENEPGRLFFKLEAKSSAGAQKDIDRFIAKYNEYLEITKIEKEIKKSDENEINYAVKDEKISFKSKEEPIISEIRTGDQTVITYRKSYDFSKQEIIHIQTFLYRLGYDPGPADGTMNSKTLAAIEKFKLENKVVSKLF